MTAWPKSGTPQAAASPGSGPAAGRPSALEGPSQALRQAWQRMAPRERRAVSLAAWVLGLGLVWAVGIAPALRTLREAPARLTQLESQWQVMQRQAADAARWKQAPPLAASQAGPALKVATDRLGAGARLSLQGGRATLTFENLSPAALQSWLVEARAGARAVPVEARWTRQGAGLSGTLVVTLPQEGG